MQRETRKRFTSHCVSLKGNSHNLYRDTMRGFFMPSNRVRPLNSEATRNEDKPDPCEVNINPRARRNNK